MVTVLGCALSKVLVEVKKYVSRPKRHPTNMFFVAQTVALQDMIERCAMLGVGTAQVSFIKGTSVIVSENGRNGREREREKRRGRLMA